MPIPKALYQAHNDHRYRAPIDLAVSATTLRKGIIIGSCFARGMMVHFKEFSGLPFEHVLFNNLSTLPDLTAQQAAEYEFGVFIPALSFVLPEAAYLRIAPSDEAALKSFYDECGQRLRALFVEGMKHNSQHKMLTFVCNFVVPQQNPLGRLLPQNHLSNLAYFIRCLNDEIAAEVLKYKNAYLLDTDGIAASFGKRFIHSENMWTLNNGLWLNDWDTEHDSKRMEVPESASKHYFSFLREYLGAIWAEILASCRTLKGVDSVKLVVFDLDDTLWRGVPAENGIHPYAVGGWHGGVIEALHFLKKRGVLLGIASKNDEATITRMWTEITQGEIGLEDFAVKKINFMPKSENMKQILSEVSLLPRNVVFVDDNPAERAAMKAAFPEMRVLGEFPYYLKRVLLWGAETQVKSITAESANRTQMMQQQVKREEERSVMSREEFLKGLNLKVKLTKIASESDAAFERALELLNKTNQFNTTGKRWTLPEMTEYFAKGGSIYSWEAKDKYTQYGIVGVALVSGESLTQFAMSCRVLGLGVEDAVLSAIEANLATEGSLEIRACFVETQANTVCRELYKNRGYEWRDGVWQRKLSDAPRCPGHVELLVVLPTACA